MITKKIKQDSNQQIIVINKQIESLDDLIELGEFYNPSNKYNIKKMFKNSGYNIDIQKIYNILPQLKQLNNIIGMESVKKSIIGQIIYFLQYKQNQLQDMMHTIIIGQPGVGKTLLAKIIGQLYSNLGIIQQPNKKKYNNDNNFVIATRSDLIAGYLGQTAIKTQKIIDSALGGVLFIDEAYSLGNKDQSDCYTKECIDTINLNLTEKKNQILVILAGYEKSLDECFFAYNEGLKRRFPFKYQIQPYTYQELRKIFIQMLKQNDDWNIKDDQIPEQFFKDNYKYFNNYAGDIEVFLFSIKIEYSKRIFCQQNIDNKQQKFIIYQDILNAFDIYKINKYDKKEELKNDIWRRMYL